MPKPYATELSTAIEAVRQASLACRSVQAQITPDVLEKKDRSPVTMADFASQALVCRSLSEAFGNDPVIAEEDAAALREPDNTHLLQQVTDHVAAVAGSTDNDRVCQWIDHGGADQYSQRFWTLDPIDGTKGFLRKEQYAVSLALIVEGQLTVAALGCPNLSVTPGGGDQQGAIFYAVLGQGAFVVPIDDPQATPQPVCVTETTDPAQACFCESVESGHSSHSDAAAVAERLGITRPSVRLDSQAKYATVARGEADIYLRLPTRKGYVERIWDHAGGCLVVSEAGGRVTDIHGKPLEFHHGAGLEANQGLIVTNDKLHDQILDALAAVNATD